MSPSLGYSHYHIMQAQRRLHEQQAPRPEAEADTPMGAGHLSWTLPALAIVGLMSAVGLLIYFAT